MKKPLVLITLSTLIASTTLLSTAMAATTNDNLNQTQIVLNGQTVDTPKGLVHNSTMYVPVWYIMHALDALGVTSKWNGNWYMTTPSTMQPDLSSIKAGTGKNGIYVNGTLVQKVNGIAYLDPSSGKNTMYMPIWYVMQILKRIQYDSAWNGSKWAIVDRNTEINAFNAALNQAQNITESQQSGTLDMNMMFNLTPQGQQSLSGSSMPAMELQMQMTGQTGIVNGEQASYVTLKPLKDTFAAALPPVQEVYTQGSNAYSNSGSGWQVAQTNQSAQPFVNAQMQRQALGDVTPTALENGYQFNAPINFSSNSALVNSLVNALSTQVGGSTGLTTSQMTAVLKSATGTAQFTVTPDNGENRITHELVNMTMTIPASDLFTGTDQQTEQMLQDVSHVTYHETVDLGFTYNSTPVVPPTNLPAVPQTSTNTNSTAANTN